MTVDLLLAIIREKLTELENKEWPRIGDSDKIIILFEVLGEYEKRKSKIGGGWPWPPDPNLLSVNEGRKEDKKLTEEVIADIEKRKGEGKEK